MTTVVDYATTYFEFPTLDKIHGTPTFRSLQTLKRQLKANCQTVISDLGGGHLGLLGLLPRNMLFLATLPLLALCIQVSFKFQLAPHNMKLFAYVRNIGRVYASSAKHMT